VIKQVLRNPYGMSAKALRHITSYCKQEGLGREVKHACDVAIYMEDGERAVERVSHFCQLILDDKTLGQI
jgi:hypothetical protein